MKKILAFVAVVAVLLGLVLVFTKTPHQSVQPVVSENTVPGAIPGNDIPGPCYSVNGQYQCKYHDAFNTVASTTCSRLSPSATSTLSVFSANISSSSPVATIYELGTAVIGGSDAWATTTLIGTKYSVGAQGTMSITGSTTPSAIGSIILGPNTRVNFKGGTPSISPKGTCNYTFTIL